MFTCLSYFSNFTGQKENIDRYFERNCPHVYRAKLEFKGVNIITPRVVTNVLKREIERKDGRKSVETIVFPIFSIDTQALPPPISFCSLCHAYLARHTASGVITRKGYMNASQRGVEKLYARNLSLLEPPVPRTRARIRDCFYHPTILYPLAKRNPLF